jgi:hypothetical protein
MDGVETAPAAFVQHADQVDHHIGALNGRRDAGLIGNRRRNQGNLADIAGRLQEPGLLDVADRDPHPPALRGQMTHQMPADKARAAEDRYQFLCHGSGVRFAPIYCPIHWHRTPGLATYWRLGEGMETGPKPCRALH